MKKSVYFSRAEQMLFGGSTAVILAAFVLFDRQNYLTLAASLIGVTSLILGAKGNPVGQALMLVFSALYGIISYRCAYYGEMMTYLGMTAPMAAVSLVSWLRHPYAGQRAQVAVNRLRRHEWLLLTALTAAVTGGFYFILAACGTAALPVSTVSVATSFVAAYLTFRRSAAFPLAYAANDVVLVVLWARAACVDVSYGAVLVCFAAFLVNDLYAFMSWRRMARAQAAGA